MIVLIICSSARRAIQFAFQRRIENPKDFSLLEIVNVGWISDFFEHDLI